MEKPLETAWEGPKFGWEGASGYHQESTNIVSQVDGVLDMMPACLLCGEGLRKGTVPSVSTSVWEKGVPQLSP